jgi:hypothetical protein
MSARTRTPSRVVVRKIAASLAVIGAVASLELFTALGPFDDAHDPIPHSVVSRP